MIHAADHPARVPILNSRLLASQVLLTESEDPDTPVLKTLMRGQSAVALGCSFRQGDRSRQHVEYEGVRGFVTVVGNRGTRYCRARPHFWQCSAVAEMANVLKEDDESLQRTITAVFLFVHSSGWRLLSGEILKFL